MTTLTDEIRSALLESAKAAAEDAKRMPALDRYHQPEVDIYEGDYQSRPHRIGEPPKTDHQYTVELTLRFDKFHTDLFDTVPRDINEDNDHVPMHNQGRTALLAACPRIGHWG